MALEFLQTIVTGPPHTTGFFSAASRQPRSESPVLLHVSVMLSWGTQLTFTTQQSVFDTSTLQKSDCHHLQKLRIGGTEAGILPLMLKEQVARSTLHQELLPPGRVMGAKHLSNWKWSEVLSEGADVVPKCICSFTSQTNIYWVFHVLGSFLYSKDKYVNKTENISIPLELPY